VHQPAQRDPLQQQPKRTWFLSLKAACPPLLGREAAPTVDVDDPRALVERLTAAQNAHDLEGMLACFHEDYRSEQPMYPARTFQGVEQVRSNWSQLLHNIPDFHSQIIRSAVNADTVFVEVHWTGTRPDGAPFEERGVLIMGVRENRIAWGRLYAEEVEHEGADIDAVVRRMAGTEEG
jgi:ketosteroid isomerase-like protein